MNEVQTVKRVISVFDAPVHVGAARLAGVTSNGRLFVDDLELLKLAAEVMRRNDHRKAEADARAQMMVTHAQEEVKIIERLLQASESARIAAEMEMQKTKARLEEAESLLETRTGLAEQERIAIDQRARAAEQRAKEAEEGLERLQAALRALFKRGLDLPEFVLNANTDPLQAS